MGVPGIGMSFELRLGAMRVAVWGSSQMGRL